MKYSISVFLLLVVFIFTSCNSLGVMVNGTIGSGGGVYGGGSYPEAEHHDNVKDDGVLYFSSTGIEKGHLPPPGSCRIWYPGEPAGQQPPPVNCDEALATAPIGSWVVYKDHNDPKMVVIEEIVAIRPLRTVQKYYRLDN
ncbi:hypothetical protein [Mangrovivirga cuniculi]|uniref:Lipoprotein n=1 Tax=Mangrovivirga cuniculi TaxID=2715131 RepID=A0A4D7JP13_9BACT|nr:hypothetical protein [Mangrovivirga cuniculi]QCK15240.1 hypothetical protein DCC35_11025 [Mangrovivirga cuniculi]